MLKPLLLLAAACCVLTTFAQIKDSLVLLYKSDQFTLSKSDKVKLDNFIQQNWDRIAINGYTDETDEEDYNLELSKKRSGEVYRYFMAKKIPANAVFSQYFGESMPIADNDSDDGRAQNRRTVIIGYRLPKITVRPKINPMEPVTKTLNNGFIITYRPGTLPDYLANGFSEGSGDMFRLVTNTVEMRQNNLYNNTTNNEILSSVLIVCNNGFNPCKLDSPVIVQVPIPFKTKCPLEKVKFFNAVAERGKQIWKEQSKDLYPETIRGVQYIRLAIDDFCSCINFDFKIDPDCFDVDSSKIQWVNNNIRNLTAELQELNSVYMPRKIDDTTHSVIYLKDKPANARISFHLYNGKRRVRAFSNEPLTAFPYDDAKQRYMLSTGNCKLYFPKQEVWNVALKVNKDKYRVYSDSNKFDFTYLHRPTETILVDFTVMTAKKRFVEYKNQPLESLPYDEKTGFYIIDKNFLKLKKQSGAISRR